MKARGSCHFNFLGQSLEVSGMKEGDTIKNLRKIVYLGDGHTMAVDASGRYYSTRIRKNVAYIRDAKSCIPYAEGIARLGGLSRATVRKFKEKKAADEKRESEGWNAQQALKHLHEIKFTLLPAQRRLLEAKAKFA